MASLATLFHELLFNHCLSCNTCVICPWNIEGLEVLHSLSSYDGILDCYGQGVTDVKIAGYVWWRETDDESWLFGCGVSMEKFILVPPLIPILLDSDRVISILHFSRISFNFDSFIKWKLRGFLFLFKHIRSLLLLFA